MTNRKNAIITGSTSGIGMVIACHLVQSGYSVIVLGRSEKKLAVLMNRLNIVNSNCDVSAILCDLSSFESVKQAIISIKSLIKSIDLLVLNAGLWNFEFIESKDKIEETIHVNLLSQILIFNELEELIPKNGESKVIFTSSGLHQGKIQFGDLEFRQNFSGFKAYRQSKLGLLLLSRWLANQEEYSGISFFSVHPGMVNTNLGRSAGWLSRSIFKLFGKSKEKGAETHIHLINEDAKLLQTGEYYANSKVTKTTKYSYQMEEANKLWDIVQKYLKN
jgi:NAD(P)-dependent dehydrogenase (short-subunit alcohol dehydrogenase family)